MRPAPRADRARRERRHRRHRRRRPRAPSRPRRPPSPRWRGGSGRGRPAPTRAGSSGPPRPAPTRRGCPRTRGTDRRRPDARPPGRPAPGRRTATAGRCRRCWSRRTSPPPDRSARPPVHASDRRTARRYRWPVPAWRATAGRRARVAELDEVRDEAVSIRGRHGNGAAQTGSGAARGGRRPRSMAPDHADASPTECWKARRPQDSAHLGDLTPTVSRLLWKLEALSLVEPVDEGFAITVEGIAALHAAQPS